MKKNILVAPLNWGLGHATRCIPIIKELQTRGFNVIIASDGNALSLLKKEFPNSTFITLPSYNITYSKKDSTFKWKLALQIPKIITTIFKEKKALKEIIGTYKIDGIISDNRLGMFQSNLPSVFITHQLNVLTGNTTWLTSQVHKYFIDKFDQCWIPDIKGVPNLSGDLGHSKLKFKKTIYIGPLSRFKKNEVPLKKQLLVILSGPEPQRTLFEVKLIQELKRFPKKILFIKGIVESKQIITTQHNFTFYNYMTSEQLENAINESEMVLCRSGYTSVMDLAILNKKAFFIPTPGQYEQKYLAKKFKNENRIPSCSQDNFKVKKLSKIDFYSGFTNYEMNQDWDNLFSLF